MFTCIPAPFPEECARGYIGRLWKANGETPTKYPDIPKLLTEDIGLNIHDLVTHHSHIGYLRFASYQYSGIRFSDHSDCFSNRLISTFPIPSESARFCPGCVSEDEEFHGISYWKRSHQLPGIDVCGKHEMVLHEINTCAMRQTGPCMRIDSIPALANENLREFQSNPLIQKFIALSDMALHMDVPFSPAVMANVLTRRKLERDKGCKRIPLSEEVRRSAPNFWVSKHFPALFARYTKSRAASLDDVLRSRHIAHATKSYLLAMAVVWERPDEAMKACLDEAKRCNPAIDLPAGERAAKAFLEGMSIQAACRSHGALFKEFEDSLRRMFGGRSECCVNGSLGEPA